MKSPTHRKTCPLCGSQNQKLLYNSTIGHSGSTLNQYVCTSNSYGLHGPIYQCRDCHFVFIVDNTKLKNILDSYKKVQDPLYVAEEAARIKTFTRHLRNIAKLCSRGLDCKFHL